MNRYESHKSMRYTKKRGEACTSFRDMKPKSTSALTGWVLMTSRPSWRKYEAQRDVHTTEYGLHTIVSCAFTMLWRILVEMCRSGGTRLGFAAQGGGGGLDI